MFRFGNAVLLRAASPGPGVLEEAMWGLSPRTSSSTESQGVNSQCPSQAAQIAHEEAECAVPALGKHSQGMSL